MVDNIEIQSFKRCDRPGYGRIEYDLVFPGSVSSSTIFIEVDSDYSQYLCNCLCDPLIVLLLPRALLHGWNISSDLPMSEGLYHNLVMWFIPELVKCNPEYHMISINVPIADVVSNGQFVGASASGGVDASATITMYRKSAATSHNITHLVNFNFTPSFFTPLLQPQTAAKVAYEERYPLINICSNGIDVVGHEGTHSWLHFYFFELLALKNAFRYYHVSSAYHYTLSTYSGFVSSDYVDRIESYLVNACSYGNFTIDIDSYFHSRTEKLQFILKNGSSRFNASCGIPNCGWCNKCIRTLACLDSINALDAFSSSFDVKGYRDCRDAIYTFLNRNNDNILIKMVLDDVSGFATSYCTDGLDSIRTIGDLRDYACAKGIASAFYSRGMDSYKRKQYKDAISDLLESIRRGYHVFRTYFVLSHCCRDGIGTSKDLCRAAEFMKKAIELSQYPDHVPYQCELYDIYNLQKRDKKFLLAYLDTLDGSRPEVLIRKSRILCRKRDTFKEAVGMCRDAVRAGAVQYSNELFDMLWRQNTPESDKEAFDCAMTYARLNNGEAMGRVARAYRDGRGVEKNLSEAARWMRSAWSKGVSWASWELFTILRRINTPESLKEMIDLGTPLAEAGNRELQARMSIAYRDGLGVPKDLDRAINLMRKAKDQKLGWANNELFDMLLAKGTPESVKEAIDVIRTYSETGDADALLRLGKAYRDGLGVDVNSEKAESLFRSSFEKGNIAARRALIDLLATKDDDQSKRERLHLLESSASVGDIPSMVAVGRMYRDGEFVDRDIGRAAYWMTRAADSGYVFPESELYDVIWQNEIEHPIARARQSIQKRSETGTVIFSLTHAGYLWQLIAIRYAFHMGDRCILVLTDHSRPTPFFQRLVDAGVFASMVVCDCWRYVGTRDENVVTKDMVEYLDTQMSSVGASIEDAKNIYNSADLIDSFGLYCSLKGVCYTTLSWGTPDMLFNLSRYYWGSKYTDPRYARPLPFYLLQKRYDVLCQERSVYPVIFSTDDSPERISERSNYSVCDYVSLMKGIDVKAKRTILSCIPDLNKISSAKYLLLPNSINPSTKFCNKSLYPYIYQVFIDYYLHSSDSVVIKTHPTAPHNLDGGFPAEMMVSSDYPIELLGLNPGLLPDTICGVFSGSLHSRLIIPKHKIEATAVYFELFNEIHEIYAANAVLREILESNNTVHYTYTDDEGFLRTFASEVFGMQISLADPSDITVGRERDLKRIDEGRRYILFSDRQKPSFNAAYARSFRLFVEKGLDTSLAPAHESYIHVYSPEGLAALDSFGFALELRYSGTRITLSVTDEIPKQERGGDMAPNRSEHQA